MYEREQQKNVPLWYLPNLRVFDMIQARDPTARALALCAFHQ